MDKRITVRVESVRGCGYRKEGGIYMVGKAPSFSCGALPIPVHTCPTCGCGIKPARGFTWVNIRLLAGALPVCTAEPSQHSLCPLGLIMDGGQLDRCGLLWVGSKFYKNPEDILREAQEDNRGFSRRIPAVPNDFIVGKHWIALGHREAIVSPFKWGEEPEYTPGIFSIFKPTAIEYICTGEESEEEIDRLLERGLTPIAVRKDKDVIGEYSPCSSCGKVYIPQDREDDDGVCPACKLEMEYIVGTEEPHND